MTLRLNLVNLRWDGVTGATSYDILLDNVKVSQAGPRARTTKITIPEGAERKVTIKAQPSGQTQEATFEWASVTVAPPPTGDKFAAPGGSDSNPGTLAQPYATFRRLVNSLAAGQVGMLRGGTYGTADTYQPVTVSGTSSQRITVTNYPGESVTIKGYIDVPGSYVTFRNLHIDGSNSALVAADKCGTQALGITPKGAGIVFEFCEIYHSGLKGSGFVTSGNGLIIRYCKIHDIGSCFAYDHGVYAGDGDGIQVYGNWIWNNPHGYGIQVYPGPSNGRFYANVLDACGSGFTINDDGKATCVGNDVYNNVVMNCVGVTGQGGWHDIGAGVSGPGPSGAGNKFRDNCCYGNAGGVGTLTNVAMSGNITSNPNLADVANHDYRPTASTPAAVQAYGLPTLVGPTV